MDFSLYKWEVTPTIQQLLIKLEAVKLVFEGLKINPQIEENLRKTALLKSAVYSARIEGFLDTVNSPKLESQNLVRAYNLVRSQQAPKNLTLGFTKSLHKLVLMDISGNAGQLRGEAWAIYNQAGVIIHTAWPHYELPEVMPRYVSYVNGLRDHSVIKAAVAQFVFEKIHPFADGNGRAGRLVSAFLLARHGYGFRGLAPFEQYIDEHRDAYYYALQPSHKINDFIEYVLEALTSQALQTIDQLKVSEESKSNVILSPRRQEIVQLIQDHPYCSLDSIHRRFMNINVKTLAYDISQLIKQGHIKKVGSTRGASYLVTT